MKVASISLPALLAGVALLAGCASTNYHYSQLEGKRYFRVPIEVSTDRLLARRVKLKFYEAGMDMGWSANAVESFKIFQGKVLEEYDRIVEEFDLSVIPASGSITEQQRTFRKIVSQHLAIEDPNDELDELS